MYWYIPIACTGTAVTIAGWIVQLCALKQRSYERSIDVRLAGLWMNLIGCAVSLIATAAASLTGII